MARADALQGSHDGSGDVTLSDAVDSVAEMLAQAALPNPGGLEFRVRR